MKFKWEEKEKEKFYRKAEKELKESGIDFMEVDRTKFGIQGLDEKGENVKKVYISLSACSFQKLTSERMKMLKKLNNWECLNTGDQKKGQGESQVFMHSRLVFQD